MPPEEHDIFTLTVEGLMVKPCGLTSASLVVELFSMQFCLSIYWVARHMMEMWILEDKYFSCINGDTSDTSKKLYEQFGHTCWLDDAYTHWVWTWNSDLCHCSNIIVRFNADVHQAHK